MVEYCEDYNIFPASVKVWGISSLAERLLISQGGHYFMELASSKKFFLSLAPVVPRHTAIMIGTPKTKIK